METASWHGAQNIPTKYVDFPDHQDLRLELPRLSCHSLVKELYHPFVEFFFKNIFAKLSLNNQLLFSEISLSQQ